MGSEWLGVPAARTALTVRSASFNYETCRDHLLVWSAPTEQGPEVTLPKPKQRLNFPAFSVGCSSTGNYTPLLGSRSPELWNATCNPALPQD